jgi:hypothetical protein
MDLDKPNAYEWAVAHGAVPVEGTEGPDPSDYPAVVQHPDSMEPDIVAFAEAGWSSTTTSLRAILAWTKKNRPDLLE